MGGSSPAGGAGESDDRSAIRGRRRRYGNKPTSPSYTVQSVGAVALIRLQARCGRGRARTGALRFPDARRPYATTSPPPPPSPLAPSARVDP